LALSTWTIPLMTAAIIDPACSRTARRKQWIDRRQRSKAPLKELAAQYGLNQKTVAKWHKRAFVHDAPMVETGPTRD
jgi:hypothetical protein